MPSNDAAAQSVVEALAGGLREGDDTFSVFSDMLHPKIVIELLNKNFGKISRFRF